MSAPWPRQLLAVGLGLSALGCSSGSGGGLITAPGGVTLADVQARVFTPRCAVSGCHVSGAPHGLDLRAGLAAGNTIDVPSAEVSSLLRVAPFDSVDSYLYMKLVEDPRILGDRMPALAPPLNAADLALVQDWIDQGAL